jgi:phage gp36-like protein
MAYVDIAYFRVMGSIPDAELDDFVDKHPGRFEAMSEAVSRLIDSYLFKRYATPFKDPVPEAVKFHAAQILSYQIRIFIGFDPSSQQDGEIVKARDEAIEWLSKAANARDGLVELPLREPEPGKQDEDGVSRRRARAFSFRSPIDWHRTMRGRR